MISFDDLIINLKAYLLETEQATVCVEIVRMLENRRCENLRMLTYVSFSKETNRDINDPNLILAINFLAAPTEFKLLDKHYRVLSSDGSLESDIEDHHVADAFRSGQLELPNGEMANEDIERFLYAYFAPSKNLIALKRAECPK